MRDCVSDIKRRLKELLQREAKARGGTLHTTINFFLQSKETRTVTVTGVIAATLYFKLLEVLCR